ncbi:MAG: amidohydrolase [Chitinophagales bacterium]
MLSKIKAFRKELHQNPELSGFEAHTAKRIKAFVEANHHPTKIIEEIGGNGLAVVYEFPQKGATIVIRCELDALPIEEKNTFEHRSVTQGVSHKCGHDGHIAMVAGLVFWLKEQTFQSGKIVLLFQPAEETGEGAFEVLKDERFKNLKPDYIFALHNIPGEPLNRIVIVPKNFSATVQSLTIHLMGKESHAAEPENGINPAIGMAEIILEFSKLNVNNPNDKHFAVLTPVHLNMGQKSYGISAGIGELHYTIRTWTVEVMSTLKERIYKILNQISMHQGWVYSVDWFEYFPTVQNSDTCNEFIRKAAQEKGFEVKEKAHPFKFGEDFGWFSQEYQAAMFGLGAGVNTPALHHADYDFPDEILETGMDMFKAIIEGVIQ